MIGALPPNGDNSQWTEEKTDRLIHLWNKTTMPAGTIAHELGTTVGAVCGRIRRLRKTRHDIRLRGSPIKRRLTIPDTVDNSDQVCNCSNNGPGDCYPACTQIGDDT